MGATAREAVGQLIGQAYTTAAYLSQAESTLASYNPANPTLQQRSRCSQEPSMLWMRLSRPWMEEGRVVICPKVHLPDIQKAAKDNWEKFKKDQRTKSKDKNKCAFSYSDLDDNAKKKIAKEVFEAHLVDAPSVASSITSPTAAVSMSTHTQRIHRTLFCSIAEPTFVLNANTMPPCCILPVPTTNVSPPSNFPLDHPPMTDSLQSSALSILLQGLLPATSATSQAWPNNTLIWLFASLNQAIIAPSSSPGLSKAQRMRNSLLLQSWIACSSFTFPFTAVMAQQLPLSWQPDLMCQLTVFLVSLFSRVAVASLTSSQTSLNYEIWTAPP